MAPSLSRSTRGTIIILRNSVRRLCTVSLYSFEVSVTVEFSQSYKIVAAEILSSSVHGTLYEFFMRDLIADSSIRLCQCYVCTLPRKASCPPASSLSSLTQNVDLLLCIFRKSFFRLPTDHSPRPSSLNSIHVARAAAIIFGISQRRCAHELFEPQERSSRPPVSFVARSKVQNISPRKKFHADNIIHRGYRCKCHSSRKRTAVHLFFPAM